jgi:hypothetical protein
LWNKDNTILKNNEARKGDYGFWIMEKGNGEIMKNEQLAIGN